MASGSDGSGADELVIDLEDAVAVVAKAAAREGLPEGIGADKLGLAVRVNAMVDEAMAAGARRLPARAGAGGPG